MGYWESILKEYSLREVIKEMEGETNGKRIKIQSALSDMQEKL